MFFKGRRSNNETRIKNRGVVLDWIFDSINSDLKIQTQNVDTKNQLADMLTNGNFTRDEWDHFSSFVEHHESLDVFLLPFSFYQKAGCRDQQSSGKYSEKGIGSGETETNEFGVERTS